MSILVKEATTVGPMRISFEDCQIVPVYSQSGAGIVAHNAVHQVAHKENIYWKKI